jgi:DNA-3-methyladenine glycosylase I
MNGDISVRPAVIRCEWANSSPAMADYHDQEWGVPLHNDRGLFEMLTLEGAQAGLSWRTILDRRHEYRRVFHDFDIARVAAMTDARLEAILRSSGIVRNRLKVLSVRRNAEAALEAIAAHGSLDTYLWEFVSGAPIVNRWTSMDQVPARTEVSDRMSKALRKAGFSFVGSTICYAFMQATGMVNDHLAGCFRSGPSR